MKFTKLVLSVALALSVTSVASTEEKLVAAAQTQTITQGEFITGLSQALKLGAKGQWEAYQKAKDAGLLNVAGWKYEPTKQLTRHDVMRLALKSLENHYDRVKKPDGTLRHTDEEVVVLFGLLKNYPDKKFHGEDTITKADAQYTLTQIHEWIDAKERGNPIFQAFHNSLKVENGVLKGKVPKSPSKQILISFTATDKNGQEKIFTDGSDISLNIKDFKSVAFFSYDRSVGRRMAVHAYKNLPTLNYVEVKVSQ